MDPDLSELFEEGSGDDEIAAIIRLGHPGALPDGVRVITQFGEIVTVRLKRGSIPNVSQAAEVASMTSAGPLLGPDLEVEAVGAPELSLDYLAGPDDRRPSTETATGRGVVIGVVDWGFDFAHPDFRTANGGTRILAMWDQRGGKRTGSPQPFDYGIVHDREEINRALSAKDPYAALGYHPADADTGQGCHATHVASIAAGSGGPDRPVGIAPNADLVFVHNAPLGEEASSRLGDRVTLLEAIDFIARTAGDRPWVINLSMGTHGESHEGTTHVEQGLDAVIRSGPGKAIINSCGNYFNKRIHASGQLRSTEKRTFLWEINEGGPTDNELEVWYSWKDKLEAEIRAPDDSVVARCNLGERVRLMSQGKEVGNAYHRQDPDNLENHIDIFLYRRAPSGPWEVTLTAVDVVDGRFHAWIERDSACPRCQSHFRTEDAVKTSTTGSICNGFRTIAVGAFSNHDHERRVAPFSSVGPTADMRLKPDLCAPGVSILAARSTPRKSQDDTPLVTRMSGTSMAAPHVTGTVALMFQAAPRKLRIEETRNLLLESAERVSVPEEIPDRIGIGYLDVEKAVDAARRIGNPGLTLKPQSGAEEPIGRGGESANQSRPILHATESAETSTASGSGPIVSAAEIFDAFACTGHDALREQLVPHFEIVALPGARVNVDLGVGDLLIRRGEGALAQVSMIGSPGLITSAKIPELRPQGEQAGEGDGDTRPISQQVDAGFVDGLTDSAGRLLDDLLLLRLATPPTVVKVEAPSKPAGEPPAADQESMSESSAELKGPDEVAVSEDLQSVTASRGLTKESKASDALTPPLSTPVKEPFSESKVMLAESVETDGADIIELVDELVAQGPRGRAQAQILREMLSRASLVHELTMPVTGRLPSGAEIFAAFAYPGRERLRELLEQHFEIVALPRMRLEAKIRPGDLLIRVGDGDLAHVAIVAAPGLWSYDQLASVRLIPEVGNPGNYVQVVEAGERPHTITDFFARRITDAAGLVPFDQLILRLREDLRTALRDKGSGELSEATPDLAEAFSGQVYTAGWTTFMPFELGGKPHYLAYKFLTGTASIDRIRPGLQPDPATGYPVDVLYTGGWTPGWTAFVPFKLPGDSRNHYLAYKALSGEVTIDRIKADGKGVDTIWGTPLDASIKWTMGWTSFVPFALGGRPHYLAYKAASGEVTIDRIKSDGKGVDTIWGSPLDASIKWTTDWTSFVPFALGGRPHYLAYKVSSGDVTIDRIKADGKGVDTVWGTPLDASIKWTLGWTSFAPFTLNGRPHYLGYKTVSGDVTIDRIKADGKGVDTIWGTPLEPSLKWAQNWSTVIPFTMEGKPHYFAYGIISGWVAANSIAEEMLQCVSPGVSTDDPAVLSVSPVGSAEYNATVTVGGNSLQVSGNVFYPGKNAGANVPFNTNAVPGGRAPIVFIAHGNHAIFSNPADRSDERGSNPGGFISIPNYKGYVYLQSLLAGMGIISVSVDCNRFSGGIALSSTNINNRAALVLGSLLHFQSLDAGSDPTFGGHIDFTRVGLFGHSRGGEVVLRVPEILAVPGSGVASVQIKGVISLAPTDVGATSRKPAGFAFMTILPAGDGDVVRNDGAKFYDQGVADPFKCQLYIDHTNHNFFNREWVNDEMTRTVTLVISRAEHEAILSAYACAFYRSVLLGQSMRKFLEGLELPPGVTPENVHISFERTGSLTVDDYEGHDIHSNTLGKSNLQAGGLTAGTFTFNQGSGSYNSTFFGNTHGMVVRSASSTGRFRWNLAGPMDLTSREIRVRVAEVYNGTSVPAGETGFKLGLIDAAGTQAFVDSDNVGALPRPYDRRQDDLASSGNDFTKTMPSSLRFPIGCFTRAAPGFDAARVCAILSRVDRKDGRALAYDQLQIVS